MLLVIKVMPFALLPPGDNPPLHMNPSERSQPVRSTLCCIGSDTACKAVTNLCRMLQ